MAVLQSTYLLLDSTETFGGETYATILARLQTANAAKVDYTITDTELSLPGGDADVADLRLVDCLIPNVERTAGHAAGDISGLHSDNIDTAFFRDELSTDASIPVRAPDMLGRTGRDYRFVRQQQGTSPTSDDYGAGHGKTWRDAYNGPQDTAINGGSNETHQLGTTYDYCNEIFHAENSSNNSVITLGGQIDFADATAAAAVRLRGDHPRDPGIIHSAVTWQGSGTGLSWVVHSGNVHRRGDFGGQGRGVFQDSLPQKGMDPTASAADLLENFLVKAASLATISAGKFWHEGMTKVAVDAAIGDEGGALTDYTTEANEDTADDVVIFENAAVDGDAFYVGSSSIFSTVFQVGGTITGFTGIWEYWNGAWTALSDISDLSDTLKAFGNSGVINPGRLTFNHPSDWATTTVNSQGPFYYIRLRKTAGTVSGVQDKTRLYVADTTLYVQRQDNAAVTRSNEPLLRWDGVGGYLWSMDGKGNYELVNVRTLGDTFRDARNTCTDLTLSGGQDILGGGTLLSGSLAWKVRASTDGDIYYDTSDRVDRGGTVINNAHPWVADHLIAKHGSDPNKFKDMPRWFDAVYAEEGFLYINSGATMTALTVSGMFVRNIGMVHTNSVGTVKDDTTGSTGDHHSFAMRGDQGTNPLSWAIDRFCLLNVSQALVFYAPATGSGAAPASGSASGYEGVAMSDFIIAEANNVEDTGQALGGIVMTGDNDQTLYDDDTGKITADFTRFVVANLDDSYNLTGGGTPEVGAAIASNRDQNTTHTKFSALNCNYIWRSNRNSQTESCSAVIREESGVGFTDITSTVWSGGAGGALMFPATESNDDACYFAVKANPFGRIALTFGTAGVGTPTLAFEYWNGAWAAVSGLSDGTSGLTANGTIRFDKLTDWATTTINSQGPFYYMRVRVVSGTFSTNPVLDEARSRRVGSSLTMSDFYFEDIQVALGYNRTNQISDDSTEIDADNFTGVLKPGQTIAGTDLFKWGGASDPIPSITLAEFKALSKSEVDTDANIISKFAPNVSTTPGVDIEEETA